MMPFLHFSSKQRSRIAMAQDLLFSPYKLGRIELKNRIVMAPLTRNRCTGNVPNALVAEYYEQRSEAGLIVTEGTSPAPEGLGYARIPGLYSKEQIAGFRLVADAVHKKGGHVFAQLMHCGRVSQQTNLPAGARVLAPSAVALNQEIWVDGAGNLPASSPVAMSEEDIEKTVEHYAQAAENAVTAGLDGVELHGANGYLIEQFLNTASNQRTDRWGGSVENRLRFALEVARRTAKRVGGDRVGIRVSPYGVFNGMVADAAVEELYETLAKELKVLGLAYMHIVDHSAMGAPEVKPSVKQKIRTAFGSAVILSGGYDRKRAEADLSEGKGDLVAFGRPFISNPRLPTLLRADKPLVPADFATFYTPGEKGYTDYPVVG
jgi:N-ethylmaleimide reductase